MSRPFSQQLGEALHADPGAPSLDYRGRIFTKGEIAELADRTLALLDQAEIPRGAAIGVVVRNRPLHAAAMLGLIAGDRWLTTIYAMQSAQAIAEELRESGFAAVIADVADWSPEVVAAAAEVGTLGLRLDLDAESQIDIMSGLDIGGPGPFRRVEGEPGLEILSSGTTGKPKRIVFPSRMLVRMVESVMAGRNATIEPDILTWPYGGIGGMCALVASVMLGRYTALLEKFTVDQWVEAVERLKPRLVSGVPTMARMILDARIDPARLSSVEYFYGGSAPMPVQLQDEFERTYGIDVIWAYGATEFCGTIISWSPALHTEYRHSKAGAMGRALPGISLRAVDMETGAPLADGGEGYLEARVPMVSDDWIRTTDIVTIDADGFVFHHGRGDGAIIRGGYKVLPEKVAEVLLSHPGVLDAAVVGVTDARLGQAPFAAVELVADADPLDESQLMAHLRVRLTQPQIPVAIRILSALPRTTSLKVDLGALRAMFETVGTEG